MREVGVTLTLCYFFSHVQLTLEKVLQVKVIMKQKSCYGVRGSPEESMELVPEIEGSIVLKSSEKHPIVA